MTIRAAGGVLHDAGRIAIVHRPHYDDWSLPKGKLQPGESPLVAAVREVAEETGIAAHLQAPVAIQHYLKVTPETTIPKQVEFWAMRPAGSALRHVDEVDEVRWLPPDQARAAVTLDRDREVIDAFCALPSPTTAIILVRHASAGQRGDQPIDDQRPLDAIGHVQAAELATLSSLYSVGTLASALPVRCQDTLTPLAAATDLTPVVLPGLGAGASGPDLAEAARRLIDADRTVVGCVQRESVANVVNALLSELDRDPDRSLATDLGPVLRAGLVIIHRRGRSLVAIEQHQPLGTIAPAASAPQGAS